MQEEYKISVIIPVYNTEKYLPRCLNSVLQNTYQNLEVICINDGSTDNSANILEQYAIEDSRVIVISKVNEGVSVARNIGLGVATGDFIAFIDSDDWIHPQYFELLLCVQRKSNADCVVCNVEITESETPYATYNNGNISIAAASTSAALTNKLTRTNICGRIYKKSLIGHIQFHKSLRIAEDTVFNLNVLCQRDDIVIIFIGEKLYFYFQRQDSAVHVLSHILVKEAIPYYITLYQELNSKNRVYLLEQIMKTTLAYRYLAMFGPNHREVKEQSNEWIRMCMKHGKDFQWKKRFIFWLFAKIPFLYRLFRVMNDKTLLEWEKNQKCRYAKEENS